MTTNVSVRVGNQGVLSFFNNCCSAQMLCHEFQRFAECFLAMYLRFNLCTPAAGLHPCGCGVLALPTL